MIQKLIKNMKKYIDITNTNVVIFCNLIEDLNLTTYNEFKDDIKNLNITLNKLSIEIQNNISIKEISLQKISELGSIMKIFYDINKNKVFKDKLQTSFGFNGYIDHVVQFNKLIENKEINKCYFDKNKIKIKKIYYPKIGYKNSIKNDIVIDKKNIIITGPNAAGKTTILKSIMYNLILSQQIGFGFYEKANVKCYDYFHSYLNIPDTSGRDSLFQAEARRCKEIIDILNKTKDKQHFCIFDELYSGTNPYEAVASAYGYLDYLNKFKNINYVLTTHYINLCKFMKDKVVNKHMKIKSDKEDVYTYTYEYIDGISKIRGGVKVLKDLNYPTEIINNARNLLKKI
jgi:DNA mismatch repair ATPase MutS